MLPAPHDHGSDWGKFSGLKGGRIPGRRNIRGGWNSFIGLKGGGKPIRRGWGYVIGLKGGSPVTTQANEQSSSGPTTSTAISFPESMPEAKLTAIPMSENSIATISKNPLKTHLPFM